MFIEVSYPPSTLFAYHERIHDIAHEAVRSQRRENRHYSYPQSLQTPQAFSVQENVHPPRPFCRPRILPVASSFIHQYPSTAWRRIISCLRPSNLSWSWRLMAKSWCCLARNTRSFRPQSGLGLAVLQLPKAHGPEGPTKSCPFCSCRACSKKGRVFDFEPEC